MSGSTWAVLIVLGIIGAILAEIWLKRGKRRRPMSSHQPETWSSENKPALGLEAIDLKAVERTARENESLAEKTGAGRESKSWTEANADIYRPKPRDGQIGGLGSWIKSLYKPRK